MSQTYRVEQWTREGQILRAEYVGSDGQPYTLRTALEWTSVTRDECWGPVDQQPLQYRIVDNHTGETVDETEARKPWWLRDNGDEAQSTFEVALMLEELARALRADGDIPLPHLDVTVYLKAQYFGPDKDDVRRAHVDMLAHLTGQTAVQNGNSYGPEVYKVYISAYVAPAEPETAGVAAAILTPDAAELPSAEAGIETEDALGVPGLTSAEADDFMAGGAR